MRTGRYFAAGLVALMVLAACAPGPGGERTPDAEPDPEPLTERTEALIADPDVPVILAFGDSLTNGHQVERSMAYPAQLQRLLDAGGYPYQVVNYGNDGDTTSNGVARLAGALAYDPEIVILEFGGNDGLRGIPIDVASENLSTMIAAFKDGGARVVLAGLTLPRNYGPEYIASFENMYVDLAASHNVGLIPFFLEGLVDLEALDTPGTDLSDAVRHMQSDGTHPTGEGYTIVARTVFDAITPHLER
jgi:acyl-CoA thioesterase-1